MKIGALVLAAGQSKRFGGDKRQATLPNGKLVIQQTLEKVTSVFDEVLVVLRAEDAGLHKKLLNLFPDLKYHHAPDSGLGMGHSLASGIRQIEGWDGVFVFLADMPFVETETLIKLRDSSASVGMRNSPSSRPVDSPPSSRPVDSPPSSRPSEASGETSWIIIPTHQSKPGHPVGFSFEFFDELRQLTGDQGAKSIISSHKLKTVTMAVGDDGVLLDVDTPDSLNQKALDF
ncbi:MAG: nucleotidyltransferase family protein [Pseudomonadales bacterium]|nr:nucleotidyltransferase family protein [Pseudomonadales bacterium]MBO6595962.1 nucleotidyltransferase family protein [Pseudomonadales bacterium]MBO6822445.1 nucleotidyltransferase family protein [Pseudomonadales bacterium]